MLIEATVTETRSESELKQFSQADLVLGAKLDHVNRLPVGVVGASFAEFSVKLWFLQHLSALL